MRLAGDERVEAGPSLEFSQANDIVELVVLTTDDGFMQTLRAAVRGAHRLWHVASADQVGDLLLAGQVGILVLDVQALPDTASGFVAATKLQFPDLVVVVAGDRAAETSLANLISAGAVYRFIHKPMSPARAKLFADAAVRRYRERRRQAPAADRAQRRMPAGSSWPAVAVTLAVLAVLIAAVWAWRRTTQDQERMPAAASSGKASSPASVLLGRAGAALAANRLTEPSGDDALDLYLQALARDPGSSEARAGVTEVHERLAVKAESALLQERLEEAASAIEIARKSGVESGRIAFLTAKLAKLRERRRPVSTGLQQTPSQPPAEDPSEEMLQRDLNLAAERIRAGRLLEPDGDSAVFYVRQAQRIDPNGNAGEAARQTLAIAMLTAARNAIDRGDFTAADSLLDAAGGIAAEANVDNARLQLRLARARAVVPPVPPVPMPPVNDGGPAFTGDADANRQAATDEVVNANQLTLAKSAVPLYPRRAELSNTEGWVELDFTVAPTGKVEDVVVRSANPPGIFDAAAVSALRQWRYQPVLRAGVAKAQRARIRIRFTMPG